MATNAVQIGAVLRIPIECVRPGTNARGHVGDVTDLAVSLKTLGQQEPLIVHDRGDGTFTVLDGHRRLAAAHRAGLPHVDAVVRADRGGAVRLQAQLAIHAMRREFDPIAEARALHELLFVHKFRFSQVAMAIGRSEAWIRTRLALLNLDDDEQEAVTERRISIAEAGSTVRDRRTPPVASSRPRVTAPVRHRPHCASCRCYDNGATS